MWQKIKSVLVRYSTIAPLPIFAKMVLLYSFIVFFILLIVSVITVTSVHYIMDDSIKDDLNNSAQLTLSYLDSYGKIDSSVFIRSNLPPFVNLQIYDGAGKIILDNGPTHTIKKWSDRYIDDDIRNEKDTPLPTIIQGNEASEFSYYKKWYDKNGKSIISASPASRTKKITLYHFYLNNCWHLF